MDQEQLVELSTALRVEVLKSATRVVESVLLQGNNIVVTDG